MIFKRYLLTPTQDYQRLEDQVKQNGMKINDSHPLCLRYWFFMSIAGTEEQMKAVEEIWEKSGIKFQDELPLELLATVPG